MIVHLPAWLCHLRRRSMMRRRRLQFGYTTERLESRTLLAGNVTAIVADGNLMLTGDAADNSVEVTIVDGDVVVQGLEETTINGSSDPFVAFAQTTTIGGNFASSLSDGSDTLRVTGPLTISGRTRVVDDSGATQVGITDATLEGPVHIATGHGDDALSITGSALGSHLSIMAGGGSNLMSVFDTTIAGDVSLSAGGHLRGLHRLRHLHLGRHHHGMSRDNFGGGNEIVIVDSTVGSLRFSTGRGADNVVVQNSAVGGSLRGSTGSGSDFVMFDGATVTGRTSLNLRRGDDKLVTQNANMFNGDVRANGGRRRSDAVQMSAETVFAREMKFRRFQSSSVSDMMIAMRGDATLDAAAELRANLNGLDIPDPDNTPPTTSGIDDITVAQDAPDSVINLFAAFDDAEDLDQELTFAIADNSNPGLFSSTSIDFAAGILTLDYAPGVNGTSDVTVRATDTGGLSVDAPFTVTVLPDGQIPLSLNVSSNDAVPSSETLITNDADFQIDVTTEPGATVEVDSDGDGLFDDGSTTADAAGVAMLNVMLTHNEANNGANTLRVQARNDQNDVSTDEVQVHLSVGTVVRFDSSLGTWDVELFDADAPNTVGAFLDDLSRYDASIVHRNVDEFVIQGGGFIADGTDTVQSVVSFAAPPNEFSQANPLNHNERGTLSTAQTGADINTFTGQWFINTVNNDGTGPTNNLDNVPHTVFGQVIGAGMDVVDAINNTQNFNLSGLVSNPGAFALGEAPLVNYTAGTIPQLENYVQINSISELLVPPGSENTFRLPENSLDGTSVGHVTPSPATGSPVVFQIDDPTLPIELLLNPDDHLEGNAAAQVVLIEYLSLQCPACAAAHPDVEQLIADNPDNLLVVRRHLPLDVDTGGPFEHSFEAALAAEAAGRQGMFDEMVDALFARQADWTNSVTPQQAQDVFEDIAVNTLGLDLTQFVDDMNDPQLADRINRDIADAGSLGASGTPTFFLNGLLTTGTPTDVEIQIVAEAVNQTFALNRQTGELTVFDRTDLDFETTPTFVFNVAARSSVTEILAVTVNLIDAFGG